MKTPTKTANPKLPNFVNQIYNYNRLIWGFHQLSGSIIWRVMVENVDRYLTPIFWRTLEQNFSNMNIWKPILIQTT